MRRPRVGIPTLAAVDQELGGSAAPGIGFAIASNMVKDIAGHIVDHGHVMQSHRAYLGVRAASTTGGQGAIVAAVERRGPADRAGIRPGDLITAVAGRAGPPRGGPRRRAGHAPARADRRRAVDRTRRRT